jgi:hypothetical protein
MSDNVTNPFGADFQFEEDWCREHGNIHRATARRYRNQPNGLPFLVFGGKIFIPRCEGHEWLLNRVRRLNQSKRGRQG